jgi:hypothetical protein
MTALVFSAKEDYLHFYAGLFGFMDQAEAEEKKRKRKDRYQCYRERGQLMS